MLGHLVWGYSFSYQLFFLRQLQILINDSICLIWVLGHLRCHECADQVCVVNANVKVSMQIVVYEQTCT